MSFSELVSLYFERSNAVQTFWNFQVTIILALLAFFGTTTSRNKRLLAAILSFGYVVFAIVNLIAITQVTRVRGVTKDLINQWSISDDKSDNQTIKVIHKIQHTPEPPTVPVVVAMHVTGDVCVLGGIWFLTLYKERSPS
jgi:hypothetical protein